MATRTAAPTPLRNGFCQQIVWTGLLNGDVGSAVDLTEFSDRSIAITGTFGVGGTIIVQGTNDGTNWFTLTDNLGSTLSFTAAGLKQINEMTNQIRVNVTGGDGTTSLTATLVVRLTAPR